MPVGKHFFTDCFLTCGFWKEASISQSYLKEPAVNQVPPRDWILVLRGRGDRDHT